MRLQCAFLPFCFFLILGRPSTDSLPYTKGEAVKQGKPLNIIKCVEPVEMVLQLGLGYPSVEIPTELKQGGAILNYSENLVTRNRYTKSYFSVAHLRH